MKKEINKKTLFYILILISAVLILAFIIEHKFGHEPCKLCIYERVPYFISLLLITKIIFTNGYEKITLFILSLVFIFSSILAFYHFGIEQGFFNESSVCASGNLSEILNGLFEQKLIMLTDKKSGCPYYILENYGKNQDEQIFLDPIFFLYKIVVNATW